MKTFGENCIEWRGFNEGDTHVIVATRGSTWQNLCCALASDYVTVEIEEKTSPEAVVWKHRRERISCRGCLAVLDGAVVTRVEVPL